MHPLKELHYFDTLHGVRPPEALRGYCQKQLARELDNIVAAKDFLFINDVYRCYLRSCRMLGLGDVAGVEYLDLFRPFLQRRTMLGEVTPEYMLLEPPAIASMKQVIGADATVLLVCRDPVDRLLSAVKLMNAYNNLGMESDAAGEWLRANLAAEGAWMQAQDGYNDYQGAVERFGSQFPRFLAISYDELTRSPSTVARRIREVAEIDIDVEKFSAASRQVKNDLGLGFELGDELRQMLSIRYRTQSEYFRTLFPDQYELPGRQ